MTSTTTIRGEETDLALNGSSDCSTIRSDVIRANKTLRNVACFNSLFKITETAHITNLCPYIKKHTRAHIFLWEGQIEADAAAIYRNKDAYFHNC